MNVGRDWPSPRSVAVRWALLWPPILLLVAGWVVVWSSGERAAWDDLVEHGDTAAATVVVADDESRLVRYEHQAVGEVSVPIDDATLLAGDQFEIVADPDDPYGIALPGEQGPRNWTPLAVLGALVIGALGAVWMSVSSARARGLAASSSPAFRMRAVVHRDPWSVVPKLSLYPVDATVDARAVCTVRLADLWTDDADGLPVEVDVKGLPRPGGRIVVRHEERVLWPRGRALITRDRRLAPPPPPRPGRWHTEPLDGTGALPPPVWREDLEASPEPAGPSQWLMAVALLFGCGVVLTVIVAAITVTNLREVERWTAAGSPAVAVVADRDDEDFAVAVDVVIDGGDPSLPLTMMAPADYPENFRTGDRYPATVSADGSQVRLSAEPYDAVEPILWVAIPTAILGWHLVRRLLGA